MTEQASQIEKITPFMLDTYPALVPKSVSNPTRRVKNITKEKIMVGTLI